MRSSACSRVDERDLIRLLLAGILATVLFVGCRDNPASSTVVPMPGSGIKGVVTDRFRNPARDVEVRLYYSYDLLGDSVEPDTMFVVGDASRIIHVGVYDQDSVLQRLLYVGTRGAGPFAVRWDGTDSAGHRMANGIYFVQYRVDDTIRFSATRVLDAGIVAMTDSLGRYAVTRELRAIGYAPVPIYSSYDGRFIGSFEIGGEVDLLFSTPVAETVRQVYPFPDASTRVDVTLE